MCWIPTKQKNICTLHPQQSQVEDLLERNYFSIRHCYPVTTWPNLHVFELCVKVAVGDSKVVSQPQVKQEVLTSCCSTRFYTTFTSSIGTRVNAGFVLGQNKSANDLS